MLVEGRCAYVSLAHRYWNAAWDLERNRAVYGRDVSSQGLGANLRLEAWAECPSNDAVPELEARLEVLKTAVDHHSLFDDLPDFKTRASTLETMTRYLGEQLFAKALSQGSWHHLQVWENDDLAAVVWPTQPTLQLKFKVSNLWLTLEGVEDSESGLLVARDEVVRVVVDAHAKLGEQVRPDLGPWLFQSIAETLSNLVELRIDLGRQKFLIVGREVLIK